MPFRRVKINPLVGVVVSLLIVGCEYERKPLPLAGVGTGSVARFSIELGSGVPMDRRFSLVVTDPYTNIVGAFVVTNSVVAAEFPLPAGVTLEKANYVLCEGSRIVARGFCNQEGYSSLRDALLKEFGERPKKMEMESKESSIKK